MTNYNLSIEEAKTDKWYFRGSVAPTGEYLSYSIAVGTTRIFYSMSTFDLERSESGPPETKLFGKEELFLTSETAAVMRERKAFLEGTRK